MPGWRSQKNRCMMNHLSLSSPLSLEGLNKPNHTCTEVRSSKINPTTWWVSVKWSSLFIVDTAIMNAFTVQQNEIRFPYTCKEIHFVDKNIRSQTETTAHGIARRKAMNPITPWNAQVDWNETSVLINVVFRIRFNWFLLVCTFTQSLFKWALIFMHW